MLTVFAQILMLTNRIGATLLMHYIRQIYLNMCYRIETLSVIFKKHLRMSPQEADWYKAKSNLLGWLKYYQINQINVLLLLLLAYHFNNITC